MESIAKFYNDSVVKSHNLKTNKKPIYIFGSVPEIYTWQNIINEDVKKQSYRYYNNYEGINESENELGNAWEKRRKKKLGDRPYSYGDINNVRRMEMQDIENALHRNVKVHLARKAFKDDEAFIACAKAIADGTLVRYEYDALGKRRPTSYGTDYKGTVYKQIHSNNPLLYTKLSPTDRRKVILETIARTEHLRWNASHEMLGYVKGDKKDELKMTHNCLRPWSDLDSDETKGYDYSVVDTSLKLYYAETYQSNN